MLNFQTNSQLLYKEAINSPKKVRFMVSDNDGGFKAVTWGEFLENTIKIALYLDSIMPLTDKKFVVFAKTRVEWAYFGLAIEACRGVFVPVFHTSPESLLIYITNHSDADFIITENTLLAEIFMSIRHMPKVKKILIMDKKNDFTNVETFTPMVYIEEIYKIGSRLMEKNPDRFPQLLSNISINDTATILYTSGTTGVPKGVVLTHKNLFVNSSDWIDVLGPLIPNEKIDLLWLPTSHIFGWGELGLGHVLGFKTYFTTPLEVLGLMPIIKPTIFISVPVYWEKLYLMAVASSNIENKQFDKLIELTGGRLKFCLSGGAGLKREVKEFYYKAGLLIIEGYGLTECSPTLTMNRGDDFDFDTVGKAFPSVTLKLAQDNEILAKGENIFNGYYKDKESSTEAFDKNGWFKTGDLGTFTDKEFLKIIGRKKEIIVTSGGKNISPALIESKFKDSPLIEHIVLYGNERKYLTALITLNKTAAQNLSDIAIKTVVQENIDKVNKDLQSFETIKKFYIHDKSLTVKDGFLTPALKLRRNNVYEAFKDILDKLYEGSALKLPQRDSSL
ncbi:MAG: AMP-binding protein [Nitrospirae bacterium]|nr:AMP-binding protein [Nitrospirota bacterium]